MNPRVIPGIVAAVAQNDATRFFRLLRFSSWGSPASSRCTDMSLSGIVGDVFICAGSSPLGTVRRFYLYGFDSDNTGRLRHLDTRLTGSRRLQVYSHLTPAPDPTGRPSQGAPVTTVAATRRKQMELVFFVPAGTRLYVQDRSRIRYALIGLPESDLVVDASSTAEPLILA